MIASVKNWYAGLSPAQKIGYAIVLFVIVYILAGGAILGFSLAGEDDDAAAAAGDASTEGYHTGTRHLYNPVPSFTLGGDKVAIRKQTKARQGIRHDPLRGDTAPHPHGELGSPEAMARANAHHWQESQGRSNDKMAAECDIYGVDQNGAASGAAEGFTSGSRGSGYAPGAGEYDHSAYILDLNSSKRMRDNQRAFYKELKPWAMKTLLVDDLEPENYLHWHGLGRPQAVVQSKDAYFVTEVDHTHLANNQAFHFNQTAQPKHHNHPQPSCGRRGVRGADC